MDFRMEKKHILLTGAAGFIGFHTALELIKNGYTVVGLDNLNTYYNVELKKYRVKELNKNEDFIFYEADIEDKNALEDVFSNFKFDAVINLAARAGVRPSMDNPDIYISTNLNGCINIMNEMKKRGIKKIVQASTSSVYAGHELPYIETLSINTPISPYAVSKRAAELMAFTYHHLYGLDVSVVRYFTVYGPAGRPDMAIYRIIKSIYEENVFELYGDGTQSRDFTYVEDVATGNLNALKPVGFEIFNIGGGNNPVSIIEIISYIESQLGKKINLGNHEFHSADVKATCANIDKAKSYLNWEPVTSLHDGLKKTIDWYIDNRDFARKI